MSDNPDDPWRSLADELGVQPGDETAPPPPAASPPKAPPHRAAPPSAHQTAPPKKVKSDWNALAGELGVEVPPESETAPHDPVAELLGFPPPSALPPQAERDQGRREKESYGEDYDEEQVDRPAAREHWRDEAEEQQGRKDFDDTKPVYYDEPTEGSSSRERPQGDEERSYRPSRPRRDRGGRGRGGRDRGGDRSGGDRAGGDRSSGGRASGDRAGSDRGSEGGGNRTGGQYRGREPYDDRGNSERESQADRPLDQEAGEGQASPAGESGDANQQRAQDEQSQRRRRRRRRGRGGRDRDEQRPRSVPAESEGPEDHDLPFLELVSDEELTADIEMPAADFASADNLHEGPHDVESVHPDDELSREPAHGGDELDDHDEEGLSDGDDNHTGKTSVRDIVTWKEAIGMIIEGNLQTRSHAPSQGSHHGSHNSRGPRGGHGRGGRGRGGRRR